VHSRLRHGIPLYSKHHVFTQPYVEQYSILPDRSDFTYNLMPRRHNLEQTAKSSSITVRDYNTNDIQKHLLMLTYTFTLIQSSRLHV